MHFNTHQSRAKGGEHGAGKKESPRIGTDTRTISNGWVVTNGDEEIATITMSVTTLRAFRVDHVEKLLQNIANSSHSF